MRDLYRILGVPPTADAESIKLAYRMLSKKLYPDLNPDLRLYTDERGQELVEAYNTLTDAEKRKGYDAAEHYQVRRTYTQRTIKPGAEAARKAKYASGQSGGLGKIISGIMGKGQTAERHDPKQSKVHFTLGVSLYDKRAYEQARHEFRTALKFDSRNVDAIYNLGLMSYRLGEFDDARAAFEKAASLDPADAHAAHMATLLREDLGG